MSPDEVLVRRYFAEVVDGRSDATLADLFAPDCRIQRADRARPLAGLEALRRFVRLSIQAVPSIRTEIQEVVDDGRGHLALALAHEARFGAVVVTPLGLAFPRGRSARWQALALFTVRDGKIASERIVRDEIAILRDLALLPEHRSPVLATLLRWVGAGRGRR